MEYYLYAVLFLFGTIIGSFLNVVIYRLHTGKSIQGRSHCLSCGTHLRWFELVPIISYLALRGRCRTCAAWVPMRYLAVELVTGLSFVMVWHTFYNDMILLTVHLVIVSILIVVFVYDLRHLIIPDELVVALMIVSLFFLGYSYLGGALPLPSMVFHVFAGIGAGGFFASFWLVSGGRWMGLGDAKLAIPLGLLLGPFGTLSAVVLSFWIGAGVSVALMFLERVLQQGTTRLPFSKTTLKMKSEVPFAPFLIGAFLLVYFFNIDVFNSFQTFLAYP